MKTFPGWQRNCNRGLVTSPRRGWVAVLVAFVLTAFIAIIGVALDTAWTQATAQQLHTTADAAALGGAQRVAADSQATQFASTRQLAVDTAAANRAGGVSVVLDPNPSNTPGGDVVVGRWDSSTKTFTPDTTTPDSVQVRARRDGTQNGPLDLFFGSLFGTPSVQISRAAIAQLGAVPDPLILVLDLSRQGALYLQGSASMSVPTGTVHVNSNNYCAVDLQGAVTLSAQRVDIVGNICGSTSSPVSTGELVEPDPLIGLPYPSGLALPLGPQGKITIGGTYSPGRYPRGIDMLGGTATLLPGEYSFGNGGGSKGIDLRGTALVTGDGVMLHIEQGARVDVSGGGGMQLKPPASGVYQGVTLFHHRNNITSNAFRVRGGGQFDVAGTLYIPRGHLDLGGNPGKKIGRIVVNTLECIGNAGFTITGLNVPPPTGPKYVYLVQ